MSTKKISINPDFFKLTSVAGKKEKKKKKKEKHSADLLKPNLKKELINKVNEHRKNIQKDKIKNEIKEDVKEIPNNLDQSLEYLNNLAKKNVDKKNKKKEKKRNKTVKNVQQNQHVQDNQPPYSNLKTSSRPTYSQWKKTQKNRDDLKPRNNISFGEGDNVNTEIKIFEDSFEERQKKLTDLKTNFNNEDKKKKVKRKHKTVKRRITLGKHKNRVGILIKNKKTRKNIEKEMNILKKKSMNQIKRYLRKHNLIKIGSSAPDSMLKDMFCDVYSSGDIFNKNPDILLANYIGNK